MEKHRRKHRLTVVTVVTEQDVSIKRILQRSYLHLAQLATLAALSSMFPPDCVDTAANRMLIPNFFWTCFNQTSNVWRARKIYSPCAQHCLTHFLLRVSSSCCSSHLHFRNYFLLQPLLRFFISGSLQLNTLPR